MIKMLVIDLDNTLLRSDKTISGYTEKVLKRVRDAGIRTAFATARPYRAIRHFMEQVGCGNAVYHNGSRIVMDWKNVGCSYCISHKEAVRLLQELQSRYPGKKLSVEINDRLYANYDVLSIWGNNPKDTEILKAATVRTDFTDLPEIDADKIIIEINNEEEYDEITALFPDSLYGLMSDGKTLCLVMNRKASKLNAVKHMAKLMAISRSEVAAFGDDYNDLEMIKYFGIGVAMSNAIEEVRRAADAVTAFDNNNDGVARYIAEHILGSM
jgi:Cof subfamily protein (haloacid dehalogenase superfamily)